MAYRIINKFDQSYSPDDLVFIEKGALLKKDNEDTKYLQLKLKNNSKEILSKVSITILLFDESGNQLNTQTYEYKDMFVPDGENFGIKTAIPLNREDVCSVKVLIDNNLQYVGSKADKKHKKTLMGSDDFLHCIILFVIVTTLFLQINKMEYAFLLLYSRFGMRFLEVGFAALITYPIISLMLCSKSEYKKNLIWLFMNLIGLTTQVLLRIAEPDYYTIVTIDIISNIVIFGFAIILILQSKSKDYLMIIVPYGFSCLYLVLTNILIHNSDNYLDVYQYCKVLLFILSIITIFVICYILRKLKHNKILMGIFGIFSIMAVIFSRVYSQEIVGYGGEHSELYPNLLYNFIQYEMIGFSLVLILEWFKDKYLIRKRSR